MRKYAPIGDTLSETIGIHRKRQFYATFGFGASSLEPDTSEVAGVDPDGENNTGFQFSLGWDANKWLAVELHATDLGGAGLSTATDPAVGEILYREVGVSGLFYMGKARHLDKRHGFSGFGRLGFGLLLNEGSEGVDFQTDNSTHLLVGLGVEAMSRRGLGLRAELISFEEDVKYGQLALIYRFGKKREVARQVAQKAPPVIPTPEPVVAAPAPEPVAPPEPVVAAAIPDSDQDGVPTGKDQCPDTEVGVAVDDYGCAIFNGVIEGVVFPSNSAELVDSARTILRGVVATLMRYPNTKFDLSAHTDNQGSEASNQALSRKRAVSVARFLIQNGISRRQRMIPLRADRSIAVLN